MSTYNGYDLIPVSEKIDQYMKGIYEEDLEKDWKLAKKEKGICVYKRKQKEYNQPIFLANATFKGKLENVYLNIHLPERRMKWDNQMDSVDVVHTAVKSEEKEITLVHTKVKGMGIISPREFVDVVSVKKGKDFYYNYGGSDPKYNGIPITKGYVRGINSPCGYFIRQISEEEINLKFVLNTNIGGWIPASVVNASLAGTLINIVSNVRKLEEESS